MHRNFTDNGAVINMTEYEVLYVAAFHIQSDRTSFAFSSLKNEKTFFESCPSSLVLYPDTTVHSFGKSAEDFVATSLDQGINIKDYYFFPNLRCLQTWEEEIADSSGKLVDKEMVMSRIILSFLQESNKFRTFSLFRQDVLFSDVFLIFTLEGTDFSRMTNLIKKSVAMLNLCNDMVTYIPDSVATMEFCKNDAKIRWLNNAWPIDSPIKDWVDYEEEKLYFENADLLDQSESKNGMEKIAVLKIEKTYSEVSIVQDGSIEALKRRPHESAFDSFLIYLAAILKIDDISKLQRQDNTGFQKLRRRFEHCCLEFKSKQPFHMEIDLPMAFRASSFTEAVPQKQMLPLSTEVIEDIYKSTFQSSVSVFLSIAKLLSGTDKIIITGASADDFIVNKLQETIREKCDCEIIQIENPSTCALNGAVLRGIECLKTGNHVHDEDWEIFSYSVTNSRSNTGLKHLRRGLSEMKHEPFTSLLLDYLFGKVGRKVLTMSADGTLLDIKEGVCGVEVSWDLRHKDYTLESLDLAVSHDFIECAVHIEFQTSTDKLVSSITSEPDVELSMVSSKIEDFHQKVSSDVWYMWILDKCDNTSDEIVKFATSTSSDAVKRYAVKLLISRKFEPSSVTKSILSTNDTTLIHSFLWLATVSLFKKYESSYAVEEIWPGYYCDESRKRYCIVFVYSIDFDRSPQTFWGIPIYYRNENAVSMEAREVMMYEQRLASTLKHVKDFHIADRVHDLFNCHSKLIMISCSRIKSSGYANKALKVILEPCVVLYCRIKGIIPVEEGCFPTIWNGYKVDVREAFCVFSADKRSLRMGDSIRAKTMESYGTIGGFVDLPLGGVGVITCAHVVCPASVLSNATTTDSDCIAHYTEDHCIEVTCPPQSKTLGTVEKVAFYVNNSNNISVDAALIKLKSRYPEDGRFREVTEEELSRIGYNCNFQPTFHTGEIAAVSSESCHYTLIKVGAVSGITKGLLQLSRAHAKITTKLVTKAHSSLSFTMNNQYEVQPVLDDSLDINAQHFATSGDSGSLVFMQMPDTSGLKCCGMVVATTSHGSCLMTPIENVLTDLGLSVQSLKRFHLPEESSPRPQDSNLSQTERILMSIKEKVDVIPSLKKNVDAIPRLENNVEKINDELQDTKVRVGVIEKRVTGYHCNIL